MNNDEDEDEMQPVDVIDDEDMQPMNLEDFDVEQEQDTDSGVEGGVLPFLGAAYGLSKLIPLRRRFSDADESFLKRFGNYKIGKMTVCREPIQNFIGVGLNLITLGRWQKAVAKYGYDKLFHLYLLLDLIPPVYQGKTVTAVFQKNETPRINLKTTPISNDAECKPVQQAFQGTLFDFIKITIAQMGDDFWRYNAFNNNCQTQILNALGANDLLTLPLQNFIKQDTESIAQEIPDYSKNIVQGIVDTARRGRTLLGKGLPQPQRGLKDKHVVC
jgi:hypothetical protein